MTDSNPKYYSIMRDTDDIIDQFFGVLTPGAAARYALRSTYLDKGLEDKTGDALEMLSCVHDQIVTNWTERLYHNDPSRENWRCKGFTHYDETRSGHEVILEREIVNTMGTRQWYNNVPTSSGLCGPNHDGARNIDIVHSTGPHAFTFYELKWNADTPVYAAIEVIVRGLLNVLCRLYAEQMAYPSDHSPMLTVPTIHLRVLAPETYFSGDPINLRWLETKLDRGLRAYADAHKEAQVQFDFAYESLPNGFEPPFTFRAIQNAMEQRFPPYRL